MKKDFLNIGQIVNTHGLRGEVKVIPLTDNMYRFDYLEEIILDGETVHIENVKYQKDKLILKLQNVDTIEQAEKLKKKYIKISREDAVELDEDTCFITDLIDCNVVDTEGFEYGKVKEVIQTGSNDVYWVKGKKEVLVPVLKDIVLDINTKDQIITIKPVGVWMDED